MKQNICKLSLVCLVVCLSSCASSRRSVVEGGHTLGGFEPKNDYLVEVPMDSTFIEGGASGTEILWGLFTMGASDTAEGIIYHSGNAGGGGGAATAAIAMVTDSVGKIRSLIPIGNAVPKFKSAALRNACDNGNCDVIGYPMFYIDKTDYFLWANYDVRVRGFPGRVKGVENVPRVINVKDSYWRP